MQYTDDLFSLRGAVLRARNVGNAPGIDPTIVETFLNFRMRQAIDARPYWAALISHTQVNVPPSQGVGSCTLTQGSNVVTASALTWPISDVINTTIVTAINNPGYISVTPSSMTGITNDTLLYVDSGSPAAEVVAVTEVSPSSFKANFVNAHPPNITATTSSLAYQQFYAGYQTPIYTITAVTGPVTLLLDQPWAGPTTTQSATILKMFYTFSTNPAIKDLIAVVDPQTGTDLVIHYPLAQIDWDDPQQSANDFPQYVVDYSRNLNGNFQWLIWPKPTSQRQLYVHFYQQWPDMKSRTDKPPAFLDPAILVYGALSDAWKVKLPGDDMRGNLQIAQLWEAKYQQGLLAAMQADNGLAQQQYSWIKNGYGFPGGANFWQSHDPSVWAWDV